MARAYLRVRSLGSAVGRGTHRANTGICRRSSIAKNQTGALSRTVRQWQPHLKARVTRRGIDLNISPVFFHDSLNRIQTEARAFANSFGGEERLENVGLHFFRNSWTVIANLD